MRMATENTADLPRKRVCGTQTPRIPTDLGITDPQALEDLARFRVWFAEHNDLGYV
jgi:hypothetical protein